MTHERRHLRPVKAPTESRTAFTVASYHSPPFGIQGLILEEDTWFALSSPPEFREAKSHPIRVMTEIWGARPAPPASVHVRSGDPYRILAVVHDLAQDPTWRVEWIEQAVRRSLVVAREQGLEAVGLEPLGSVHGRFPVAEFDALLQRLVAEEQTPPLRIWRIDPGRQPQIP